FWSNGKLAVSRNFTMSRVIASGPIRLIFELDYAAFSAGGVRVSETKRIQLDAGSSFNRVESRFKNAKRGAVLALGIAKHEGADVGFNAEQGWLRTWEPLNGGQEGHLGCAVIAPPGAQAERADTELDN